MISVTRFDDRGTALATIELDDFTVEILYAGIAQLLHETAGATPGPTAHRDLTREARQRREKILARIQA
jgi:hypothetical protein